MQVKSIAECSEGSILQYFRPALNFSFSFKKTKSATMNIFRFFYFLFKSFLKVELSYVFTINLFTIAENCTDKWIIL